MKIKFTVFLTLIAAFYMLFAEELVKWSRTYKGGDLGGNTSFSVIETTDGNYVVAGYKMELAPYSTDWWLKHSWILKLDAYGDTLWTKLFSTNLYVNGVAGGVIETLEGDFIISGNENGAYFLKLDADGNYLWHKRYESLGGVGRIKQAIDDGYIALTSHPTGLMKVDRNCDSLWFFEANVDTMNNCYYNDLEIANNGYIVVGRYSYFNTPVIFGWPWAVKYDTNGNEVWNKLYDELHGFRNICSSDSSNFIIAGSSEKESYFSKIDNDGNVIWEKRYVADHGIGSEYESSTINSIIGTIDDNYLAVGENDIETSEYGLNTGMFIVKLNTDGDTLWTKTHTKLDTNEANGFIYTLPGWAKSVKQTIDGGYIIAGEDLMDVWVMKVDEEGNCTGIINNEQLTINNYELAQNYPNPFNNFTTIEYALDNISDVKISVFNSQGQKVSELINNKMGKGRYSVMFNASRLNSGVYYYQLEVDGVKVKNKKMIYLK